MVFYIVMDGVLVLNKAEKVTSHDMVYFLRRLTGERKIGHTGTLDPMATGVLPMLLGNATRLSELLSAHDKRYFAKIKFGISTDTLDTTGKVIKSDARVPDYDEISAVLGNFMGEISQIPPMYSAVKINGKKLYEYARQNKEENVEGLIEPRRVSIYSLALSRTGGSDEFGLEISCSKGTYIRTLCADIGEILGTYAVMSGLIRTASGFFGIDESYTAERLQEEKEKSGISAVEKCIMPTVSVVRRLADSEIRFDTFFSKLAKNGAKIELRKICPLWQGFESGQNALMYDESGTLFALGKTSADENGLMCVQPVFFIKV